MSAPRNAPVRTDSYQRMSLAEKQAANLARAREPAVACPQCDTQTTAADLLEHVAKRCQGPRDPGPGSKWVTWRDAIKMGAPPMALSRWARRGAVRVRGQRGDRQYLLRDLAMQMASRRRQ